MKAAIAVLSVLSLATVGDTQSSSSTYVEPSVPTGTPIAANYTGEYRPQVHYSPPKGFMNDPNGMFRDADRLWHLYYQLNPTGIVAGNQHWGHATSRDLYHWDNQPIAIFPPDDHSYVFSGSAVTDPNNTSGFFPNQTNGVVAMWTRAVYDPDPGPQTQWISFSTDGGYTFTDYENNPVIDSTSSQFRDPKLFRYDDYWVVVISYAQEFTIGIFTSPNLKDWTHASNFTHAGLFGLQYECPNLIQMPMQGSIEPMYLLAISINPGAPLGGSITQYFPGTFNGTHFTAVDSAARIADFAKDNYAGQWFYGIPGNEPQVSIAWASNWQYSQEVPTGPAEGWRSTMSLPRTNYLANVTRLGYDLISKPYDLSPVLGDAVAESSSLANSSLFADLSLVSSGAIYFQLNITNLPSGPDSGNATGTANITILSSVSGSSSSSISLGQFLSGDFPFFIDRSRSSSSQTFSSPFFTDKFSTNPLVPPNPSTFTVDGVLDRSILEVFLQGGERSATVSFFAEQPMDTLIMRTAGVNARVEASGRVVALNSAWARYENSEGTVVGNVTQVVRRDRLGGGGRGSEMFW